MVCPLDGAPVVGKPDDDEALIGSRIDGRFQVEGIVGRGGMGTVFRGTQVSVGRPVAIKTLRPELVRSDDAVRRFCREAKLVSRLNHPNVVSVVDFGATGDGVLYLVMELVHGRSLHRELLHGRMPLRRAVRIASQVCDALAEAHAIGIIHRDLKPENILLTDHKSRRDFVKVVDFGVATVVENGRRAATRITNVGGAVGTPAYMCPEQVAGAELLSPAADLYSLALILFEMLTGRAPFTGTGAAQIMIAHATMPPPLLAAVAPDADLSAHMEEFIARGLAKRPEDRFADATAFRRALDDAAAGRDHDPNRRSASDAYVPERLDVGRHSVATGAPQTGLAGALTEDDVPLDSGALDEVAPQAGPPDGGKAVRRTAGPTTSVIGAPFEARVLALKPTELYAGQPRQQAPEPDIVARAGAPTAVLSAFDESATVAAAEAPQPLRKPLWPWLTIAAIGLATVGGLAATLSRDKAMPEPRVAPQAVLPRSNTGAASSPQPAPKVMPNVAILPAATATLSTAPAIAPAVVEPQPQVDPAVGSRVEKSARRRPKSNPFGLQ